MFFDYPADKESFEKILAETSPKAIHFMNYDIKYFDEKEFLKTFAGMLKFAHNNTAGKVELQRCASFLGKSIPLFELMFDIFEEAGFIKILAKEKDFYKIDFIGVTELSKVLHSSKYALVLDMAEECEHFQKTLLEDDLEEIYNQLGNY